MAPEDKAENEPTLFEQWVKDQQQWQHTVLAFLDSAVKNDDFLTHLGNAMRGSLLAGKPYPTPAAPGESAPASSVGDRLDQMLFALHQLQGRVEDLFMTLEEIRNGREGQPPTRASAAGPPKPAQAKRPSAAPSRTRKRRAAG